MDSNTVVVQGCVRGVVLLFLLSDACVGDLLTLKGTIIVRARGYISSVAVNRDGDILVSLSDTSCCSSGDILQLSRDGGDTWSRVNPVIVRPSY